MKKWFSRQMVLSVDLETIEARSNKKTASYKPFITFDSKGKVVQIGYESLRSENRQANIFEDTQEQLSILLHQAFFRKLISAHVSWFLRPRILLIPSPSLVEARGALMVEYLALLFCSGANAEVFLCKADRTPIALLFKDLRSRSTNSLDVQPISAADTHKIHKSFETLLDVPLPPERTAKWE